MRRGTPAARPVKAEKVPNELQVPSEEDIQANVAAGTFFRVDRPEGGKTTLSIRGAKSMWKKHPNFIYIPGINIAGDLRHVEQVLDVLSDGDQAEITATLEGAITSRNYNIPVSEGGQMEQYQDIFDNYARKQDILKHDLVEGINAAGEPFVTLDMLPYILENIKTEKKTGLVPSKKAPPRAVRSRRTRNLWDRIQELGEGKVLDVSKLTPEGTGAITIKTPGEVSPKVGDVSIPMVSDNLEAYALALRMISEETGQDYTQLAGNWEELHANKSRAKRKTPVRKGRVALPRRTLTPLQREEESVPPPPLRQRLRSIPARENPPSPPPRQVTPPPSPPRRLQQREALRTRLSPPSSPPRIPPPEPTSLRGRLGPGKLNLNAFPEDLEEEEDVEHF